MSLRSPCVLLRHPVLAAISDDEARDALGPDVRWHDVTLCPARLDLRDLWEANWHALAAQQEEALRAAKALCDGAASFAYLGMAPIPLALHLGYHIGRTTPTEVFQRHHETHRWGWSTTRAAAPAPRDSPPPESGSDRRGPVVIRVSTSHRVEASRTREIVSDALHETEVGLAETNEDAFQSPTHLRAFVSRFSDCLATMKRRFPAMTEIHLFAAVPVGVAYLLGTEINPTIYPPVVTYQFSGRHRPSYRRALVLGAVEDGGGTSPPNSSPRDAFCKCFGTEDKARRLLADAGFDLSRFDFSGDAQTFWFKILEEVKLQGKAENLVATARREYPQQF